jgi:hypothetical protein
MGRIGIGLLVTILLDQDVEAAVHFGCASRFRLA